MLLLRDSPQKFPDLTEEIISLMVLDHFSEPQYGNLQFAFYLHRFFRLWTPSYFISRTGCHLVVGYGELWNVTPCSPLKVNRRFGGTCRLYSSGKLATCFVPVYLIIIRT
jgi:hypothetical protein